MNNDLINSEQYLEWFSEIKYQKIEDEPITTAIEDDLNNAKNMNQYEYTLWQKLEEIRRISKSPNFFDIKKCLFSNIISSL